MATKVKVYKTLCHDVCLETMALAKREKVGLEVSELKMLRVLLGVTWVNGIRNDYIKLRLNSVEPKRDKAEDMCM